jgi:guanylate kinase
MAEFTSKVFVLSAPSGGGKSTIINALIGSRNDLCYSVSTTTRGPRGDEVNGIQYEFVSSPQFQNLIENDEFLEWAKVHGCYYGTRKSSVQRILDDHKHAVLDIDIQGGVSVKAVMPEAVLIFIMPPSLQILEKRLRDRGTDTEESILQRLENAENEMKKAELYDYIIVNNDLNDAINQINIIIEYETK